MSVQFGSESTIAHELVFRLHSKYERRKRPTGALTSNYLGKSWEEILRFTGDCGKPENKCARQTI